MGMRTRACTLRFPDKVFQSLLATSVNHGGSYCQDIARSSSGSSTDSGTQDIPEAPEKSIWAEESCAEILPSYVVSNVEVASLY